MQKLIDGEWHTADSIVVKYERLVYKHAHILGKGNHHYIQDLSQIGFIGLLRSFERFDTESGIKFMTYAYKFVRGYMMNANRNNGIIHIPINIKDAAWKIDKYDMWEQSNEVIAEELSISAYDVESCRIFAQMGTVLSADVSLSSEGGDVEFYDLQSHEDDQTGTGVEYYIKDMDEREKRIVASLVAGYSQRQVGEQVGVSAARVGQLLKKIQSKVSSKIAYENL